MELAKKKGTNLALITYSRKKPEEDTGTKVESDLLNDILDA